MMRLCVRLVCLWIASVALCLPVHAAKQRTIGNVKKEQQATQKKIKETSRKLTENTERTEKNLKQLNQLRGDIMAKNREIDRMRSELDSINRRLRDAGNSIEILNAHLETLRRDYAKALRRMQGNRGAMDMLGFIFSSETFAKAHARLRYMQEISRWRGRKEREIAATAGRVAEKRTRLGTLHEQQRRSLSSLNAAQSQLEGKKKESEKIQAQLKKEERTLKSVLKKNEQRLRQLDRDLDRMIAAEQKRQQERERKAAQARAKKDAGKGGKGGGNNASGTKSSSKEPLIAMADPDRVLTGNFESNRGRLLFPVRGAYTIVRGFGRQKHPDLAYVETDNPGVDIAVSSGTKARAIFDGTVSGVFRQDGYGIVVMVRHGSYISIYANLTSINVKNGDKLKANQDIGTIGRNADTGKTELHFEIRKERTKLNPLSWVK